MAKTLHALVLQPTHRVETVLFERYARGNVYVVVDRLHCLLVIAQSVAKIAAFINLGAESPLDRVNVPSLYEAATEHLACGWHRNRWRVVRVRLEEGPALHLACSLASGLIAQTAIQPIDTVRSCLMGAQGAAGREMVVAGLREHGPAFLYRGFFPACLRQGPVMLVQMPIVEQLRLAFGLRAF